MASPRAAVVVPGVRGGVTLPVAAEARAGRQGRIADHLCRMDLVVLDEATSARGEPASMFIAGRDHVPVCSRAKSLAPIFQSATETLA